MRWVTGQPLRRWLQALASNFGKAGTRASRPGFAAMMADMRDGESLIVSKLDRGDRDLIDVIATVRMLADLER